MRVRSLLVMLLVLSLGSFVGFAEEPKPSPAVVKMTRDANGGADAVRAATSEWPRLAAEFEIPHALLLSVSDWHSQHRQILQEIALKTRGHCPLVVLCADSIAIRQATQWLMEIDETLPGVYFCTMPTDTVWMRDFGPLFLQTKTASQVLDFFYLGVRPIDDRLPTDWAKLTQLETVPVSWTLQGGNLMANGQGLALTTNRIFEDNRIEFVGHWPGQDREHDRRQIVVEALTEACNLKQLIVLEPLTSEETQHVDMFTSFLAPEVLLVASLDAARDPVNATILERNVQRLQKVRVNDKPLKIHRVPIPARNGNAWSAYTNAILAKDLVLMPVIDTDPPLMVENAKAIYRQLLPQHEIETVNMSSMRNLQGELHCLSLHIPAFAPMPKVVYGFEASKKFYFPGGHEAVVQ